MRLYLAFVAVWIIESGHLGSGSTLIAHDLTKYHEQGCRWGVFRNVEKYSIV